MRDRCVCRVPIPLEELHQLQDSPGYGNSLVHVLTSVQKWARDISAWDLIQGIDLLTKPINQRFVRPEQPRIAADSPVCCLGRTRFCRENIPRRRHLLVVIQTGIRGSDLDIPEQSDPVGTLSKACPKRTHSTFYVDTSCAILIT